MGVINAAATKSLPAGDKSWSKVSLLNAPGSQSYPIGSFTYLLLFKDLSNNPGLDQPKAKSLVDFISWVITDGQKLTPNLGYVPLPAEVVKNVKDTLKSLTFKGTSSIHRSIELGNPVAITNVVVNEYFFLCFLEQMK
jgi:phosphate transport system substrate-binding protein